jgi:hypothetical protein
MKEACNESCKLEDNGEYLFCPLHTAPLSQTEDLGKCIKCGMDPRDFYGKGSKQGILCDLKVNNGAHDWMRGCTCTKQPHAEGCAFYRPASQTERETGSLGGNFLHKNNVLGNSAERECCEKCDMSATSAPVCADWKCPCHIQRSDWRERLERDWNKAFYKEGNGSSLRASGMWHWTNPEPDTIKEFVLDFVARLKNE